MHPRLQTLATICILLAVFQSASSFVTSSSRHVSAFHKVAIATTTSHNNNFAHANLPQKITVLFAGSDTNTKDTTVETEIALNNATSTTAVVEKESETKKLLRKVKDAGLAGVISYALWELGFWAVSLPVVAFGYLSLTGHWPDFSNPEDVAKLGAEAFAFVNFARFAVPLRIGLALSTTPWIDENVVRKYIKKEKVKDQDV